MRPRNIEQGVMSSGDGEIEGKGVEVLIEADVGIDMGIAVEDKLTDPGAKSTNVALGIDVVIAKGGKAAIEIFLEISDGPGLTVGGGIAGE
jgi:hypothetical protein